MTVESPHPCGPMEEEILLPIAEEEWLISAKTKDANEMITGSEQ